MRRPNEVPAAAAQDRDYWMSPLTRIRDLKSFAPRQRSGLVESDSDACNSFDEPEGTAKQPAQQNPVPSHQQQPLLSPPLTDANCNSSTTDKITTTSLVRHFSLHQMRYHERVMRLLLMTTNVILAIKTSAGQRTINRMAIGRKLMAIKMRITIIQVGQQMGLLQVMKKCLLRRRGGVLGMWSLMPNQTGEPRHQAAIWSIRTR